MKFTKKFKMLMQVEDVNEQLKKELSEYTFDGHIDFCEGPTCLFDLDNNIVLRFFDARGNPHNDNCFIEKEGKLIKTGENTKFLQTGEERFSKNYNLQDFFNKWKDASCIIFYVPQENPNTIFHIGNRIREAIVDKKI